MMLYNISLACRGAIAYREVFTATYHELRAIFPLDACYLAVCNTDESELFRAVLFVDEGIIDYTEHVPFGVLTGLVVRLREPLLFNDLVEEQRQLDVIPESFGNTQKLSRSWMGVPLMIGHDTVGVISVQSYQPGLYADVDCDLLQQIGNVVAVALENVILAQQQQALSLALGEQVAARTRELSALSALAAEMVLQQPLPRLLDRTLSLILPLLGMDAGNIRLLDPQRDALVLLAHRGFSEEYIQRTPISLMKTSPIRSVVLDNRPLIVPSELAKLPGRQNLAAFESLLSVPLRIGERVLGTLSLFGKEPRSFDEQAIDLAQAVGNQTAIAIEIARLFEERERQIAELRALSSVSHAASTAFDLPTLLRQVHDALRGFIRLDAFSMVIYDPEHDVISDGISIDEGQEYTYWSNQPPPPNSLTAWVIRQRQSLHFHDLTTEIERYPDLIQHAVGGARLAVSWLGMPLFDREGRVIGVIAIQSYAVGAFNERDATLIHNIARQVALHVQNVRLLTQRERQIRELDAIGQIGQLVSASFDLEEMLDGIYRTLHQATGADVFYLVICEMGTHIITNSVFIDRGQRTSPIKPGNTPAPGSLTEWILRQREPLLLFDASEQHDHLQRFGITPSIFVGPNETIRSWLGVPLLAKGGEPIGVISLQDYRSYRYDDQTIDFLSQVASHVSLGVQKVRLFEEREDQVKENARLFAAEQEARRTADTLREVARVLSASLGDLDEVLQLILGELDNVIPYDSASIMLVEGTQLRVAACRGWDRESDPRGALFQLDQSSAGQVVQLRRPLVMNDNVHNPDWSPADVSAAIRSWLGVPLISRGVVLGVLNIDSRRPGRFTERDTAVAVAFASQAAVALENARLFRESVTRVEQEMEIARQIQSNLFPHRLSAIAGMDLAARCLPARETGGDFYDVVTLSDGRFGIIVGDVSGKSLPAAMLMAVARSVARSEARDHETPQTVVCEANHWIAHDVPPNTFVALSYASLDPARRRLTLANAGQLAPLHRRADGSISYLQPPGPTLPLGLVSAINYQELTAVLAPGDTLVFYTDGIVEAKDRNRHLFGFERLEALVRDYGELPPEQFIDHVIATITAFADGVPQHDDMTLLVLRLHRND